MSRILLIPDLHQQLIAGEDYRPALYCSGFDLEKARAIYDAVGLEFWKPWKLHYREDGVLFPHAGADAEQEATLDSEALEALKSVNPCDHETYRTCIPFCSHQALIGVVCRINAQA